MKFPRWMAGKVLAAGLGMAIAPGAGSAEGIRQIDIYTLESMVPARQFEVYRNHPAFPPFRVLDIGQIEWLEEQLSEGLPASEPEAVRLARQRLAAHQSALVSAWKHHMVIRSLGITQLPAIVFNRNEAVWYGGRLDRALQAFYRHQERAGE